VARTTDLPPGRAKLQAAVRGKSAPAAPLGAAADIAAAASSFVSLATIVRVRGRIGEVAANILTDFPQRLTRLREVFLLDAQGRSRPARVRRCWLASSHGGQAIFHFEGVDSIDAARPLVGCTVQVPLAERAPLPRGRFFITDLIGCEVWESSPGASAPETTTPELLGSVRDVYLESGTPLLAVATAQGELLIPLAGEICTRIDPAARRIEVRLPPGLRELNA